MKKKNINNRRFLIPVALILVLGILCIFLTKVSLVKEGLKTKPSEEEMPTGDDKIGEFDLNELYKNIGKTLYATDIAKVYGGTDIENDKWLMVLYKNNSITVTGVEGRYYKFDIDDNTVGYVDYKYMTDVSPVEDTDEQTYWEYYREGLSIKINRYSEDDIVYWVANIFTLNPDEDINTAFAGGTYESCMSKKERVSTIATDNHAVFAVNGDSVGFRGSGNQFRNPIVIRNGELCYEDGRNIGEMCALRNDGKLIIFSPGDLGSGQSMIDSGITDVWWFDCALVKNGEVVKGLYDVEDSLSRAPYTAIGQRDKNNFIFIVVDGRGSNGSIGVTYTGMAELMKKHGAITAYELDGGGSSTIWFDGKVLNEPSDGKERKISDIIYIKKYN